VVAGVKDIPFHPGHLDGRISMVLILSTKIRRDFHIEWKFKASAVTRLGWNFIWKYDAVSIRGCGFLVGDTKRIAGARRGNVEKEKRAQRGFALAGRD